MNTKEKHWFKKLLGIRDTRIFWAVIDSSGRADRLMDLSNDVGGVEVEREENRIIYRNEQNLWWMVVLPPHTPNPSLVVHGIETAKELQDTISLFGLVINKFEEHNQTPKVEDLKVSHPKFDNINGNCGLVEM